MLYMAATAKPEPIFPAWFGADDVADWLREALPGWPVEDRPFFPGWIVVNATGAGDVFVLAMRCDRTHAAEKHGCCEWSVRTYYPAPRNGEPNRLGYRWHRTPITAVRFALSMAKKLKRRKKG